jgi:hypothetical protein
MHGPLNVKYMQKTCQKITTSLDSHHVRKQIGAHGNVPNNIRPHGGTETNLIPTLANKVRIIPDEGWPVGTLNEFSRFVTCERGSSVAWWCTHSLNYKLGGKSSANRCAFREKSYGCNRTSWKTSTILRSNSPNSHAISPELLHSSRFTAAIMAYLMAGVRMALGLTL